MSVSATSAMLDTPQADAPKGVLDGVPMFWAGLIFGGMQLVQYAVKTGELPLTPPQLGMAWMGATMAFITLAFILKVGVNKTFTQQAEVKRFRAIWGSLLIGIMLAEVITQLILWRYQQFEIMPYVIAPMGVMLFAAGWRIAAIMSRNVWLNFLSLASVLAGFALTFSAGAPWQPIAYAFCLFTLAMVPGFVLMRLARA